MERIYANDLRGHQQLKKFLEAQSLQVEDHLEEVYVLREEGAIIASGAIQGQILKTIAISEAYRGSNLLNKVISFLIQRAYDLGRSHLFIYTKHGYKSTFELMGFREIVSSERVVFMENAKGGFEDYLEDLRKKHLPGDVAAVVVNCNPFTLGHQYLIETAAAKHDWLHIFVVSEDASTFPSHVRYTLIEKGIAHLDNVTLHWTMDYIVSQKTFPSYFLKNQRQVVEAQTEIDALIFCRYIAPVLNIRTRYIGTEPYNEITQIYNQMMKRVMPDYGLRVVEIERLKNTEAISASAVRRKLKSGDYEGLIDLVPQTTYDYLISESFQEIRKKMDQWDKELV